MDNQMQKIHNVEAIKQQLAKLADVKSSVNYDEPIDFATHMTLDALAVHEKDLREQLKAAETSPCQKNAELVIEGILVMGDIRNNTFDILDNATSYHGQASESGILALKQVSLGTRIQAHLLVEAAHEESERPAYTLLHLIPLQAVHN
jgi:hypothetical protein